MKKRLLVILLFVLMLVVCGCEKKEGGVTPPQSDVNNEILETMINELASEDNITEIETEKLTESEADSEIDIEILDEELTLMQKVLLNKEKFYGKTKYSNVTPADYHKVEECGGFCRYDENTSNYFYLIDLNKDGKEEVCVIYQSGLVLIFHEHDNMVYGYNWFYRNFDPVYKDGTFSGTGGASVGYFYGNVSFEGNTFDYDVITAWKDVYDNGNEEGTSHYYKNGEPGEEGSIEITKEECEAIMSEYTMEKAEKYDFTIDNILKYVK